jgi:hypothetical protein
MTVTTIQTEATGFGSLQPRHGRMVTTDVIATITTPGYLNNSPSAKGQPFSNGDLMDVGFYNGSNGNTSTILQATIPANSQTITLQALPLTAGLILGRTPIAVSYSALPSDVIIAVTSTASARTITLPAATASNSGVNYFIKDESGAAGTNNITVEVLGGGNIDGATTKVISSNYGFIQVYSNGIQWFSL